MSSPRAALGFAAIVTLLAAACETRDVLEPTQPMLLEYCPDADEYDPSCGDDGDLPPGGDGSPTPIGWLGDQSLYDAPGDPSPGAPGVWLGSGVTPAACFVGSVGTVTADDQDADGFKDSCEYAIARSFAPYLQFHSLEECGAGEPYWAAKAFQTDRGAVVSVAYMPAYFMDCAASTSPGPHWGDSEFIRVSAYWNPTVQHWMFSEMFLSAHWHASLLGISTDRSAYVPWWETTFPMRSRTFPVVWVASGKHSNYGSLSSCAFWDSCETDAALRRRFPVDPRTGTGSRGDGRLRNVGSPYRTLVTSSLEPGCVVHLHGVRAECFYAKDKPFNGWHPSDNWSDGVTSYRTMLFADQHFETLSTGAWPDYRASIQGPDWIESAGSYSWTVSYVPGVSYVWEYSTNQSAWYPYYASTYTRFVGEGDPSFYLRVRMVSNGILVGTSVTHRVIVNICDGDVDWCPFDSDRDG